MDYSELNLHPDLARGIAEAGYVSCMPVQEATFPHSFAGEDIYAQSQTGTGKTAAFLISIFQRVMTVDALRHRKTLILAPTRELAAQIETEAKKLARYLPISMGSFYGGVSYGPQVDMLRADVQMIIGTPGRIIDLIQQGKMMLRDVGFLVVDEADRMFDMGFIDDLRKLLRYLPPAKERQTFLYSATLNFRVKNLTWEYMNEPKEIVIQAETVTVDLVTQELYHVGNDEKMRVLLGILAREKPKSALVFCNQKFMVEELARRLGINGIECEYIMGDLPQSKRIEVINRLKQGKLSLLVATDVAARGLDVDGLDLVVNYDLPADPESYVHRIGRTARAGAAGKAISLACEKFVYGLPAIEKYIETKIPVLPVTEELLAEDKSANVRFGHSRDRGKTGMEHGDRRGAGRSIQRDGKRPYADRSPGGGRPEPRRSDGRRDDRAPRDERSARGTGRPEKARPELGRASEARADARRPDRGVERNPYSVPSDERMRRYKEKYAADAAPAGKPAPRDGQNATRSPNRPARQQQGQPQNHQRGPKAGGGQTARPARPEQAAANRAAPSPQTSPHADRGTKAPGILDRLKKLIGLGKKRRPDDK